MGFKKAFWWELGWATDPGWSILDYQLIAGKIFTKKIEKLWAHNRTLDAAGKLAGEYWALTN